jgi:hypothetical protein
MAVSAHRANIFLVSFTFDHLAVLAELFPPKFQFEIAPVRETELFLPNL